MDESGDLGFDLSKHGTSKNFVITFLVIDDIKKFEKIVKKSFSQMSKNEIKASHGILHAYKLHPNRRRKLLTSMMREDFGVMTIKLNKKKVYTHLQDEKQVLYNYVTNILIDRIMTKSLINKRDEIKIIASRRETNKFFNQNFTDYITRQVANNHDLTITTLVQTPQECKCLQLADLISWSVFRYIEHNDDSYFSVFKSRIIDEARLFG